MREYVCLLKLLPSPGKNMSWQVYWSEEDVRAGADVPESLTCDPGWPLHLFQVGLASLVVPADGEGFHEGEGR